MSTLTHTEVPLSPREALPTMYDLPSEEIGGSGMPDEYHALQAVLLSETFQPGQISADEVFTAIDLNLYYDVTHPTWYKRPDWFAVIGVPRLYEGRDLRLSYVMWQEGVVPLIVVELLSPGTEREDLGQRVRETDEPPTKWEVYEQILRVPYYVVFSREGDELRVFRQRGGRYEEVVGHGGRFWVEELGLGIGLWQGRYRGQERLWLRWYEAGGRWIATPEERAEQERQRAEQERQEKEAALLREQQQRQRAEQERQRAEQERQRAERLAELLRQLGHDPNRL
jgi:Uma2 family endonuclease